MLAFALLGLAVAFYDSYAMALSFNVVLAFTVLPLAIAPPSEPTLRGRKALSFGGRAAAYRGVEIGRLPYDL
jgi:hypothetical protein